MVLASRYSLIRPLGEGGGGKVFLASSPQGAAALKFLRPDLEKEALEFFREEIQLLSRLLHPNLIRIFDFIPPTADAEEPWNRPCYAMEFLQGTSGEDLIQKLDFAEMRELAIHTCQGLRYLHRRGIFHRDIKPANLWRTDGGPWKILDFGLAGAPQRPQGTALVGTLAFTAPEAYWGRYDARSDLFSLGATLYQIASGRLPFAQPLFPENIARTKPAIPLQNHRPDLPPDFCEWVDRLLSLEASRRPGSALGVLKYFSLKNEALAEELRRDVGSIDEKPPLVGRVAEISTWQQLLSPSNTGPQFIQMTGTTGVGRSRLAEEFRWRALLQGLPCTTFSADSSSDWIARLSQSLGIADSAPQADFLAQIEACLSAAKTGRQVWVFEDLHRWPSGEIERLALLLGLALESKAGPIFLFEWNPELQSLPKLSRLLEAATGLHHAFALQELDTETCLALLREAAADANLGEKRLRSLAKFTGGNPALALSALREALYEETTAIQAPQSFQMLAEAKVQALNPEEQSILALLLCAQRGIDLKVLSLIMETKEWEMADRLLSLQERDLIAAFSPDHFGLSLRSPALGPLLWKQLPSRIQAEAHRRWLKYILTQIQDKSNAGPWLAPLLRHALAVADRPALEKFGVEALRALERQGEMQALWDATVFLAERPEIAIDPTWLFALQATAAYQLGRFPEALAAYRRWHQAKEDDGTGLVPTRYRLYLGTVQFAAGHRDLAETELKTCLRSGDPRHNPRIAPFQARAHNLLAAIYEKQGDLDRVRDHLVSAGPLAAGDPRLEGEIEQRLGSLAQRQCRYSDARGHYLTTLNRYEASGSAQAIAIARNLLAMLSLEIGEADVACKEMRTALTEARRGGDLLQTARYLGNLGLAEIESGRLSDALAALRHAEGLLRGCGTDEDLAALRVIQIQFDTAVGRWEAAEEKIRSLTGSPALQAQRGLQAGLELAKAELSLQQGRWDDAARQFEKISKSSEAGIKERVDAVLGLARSSARRGKYSKLGDLLARMPHLPAQGETVPFQAAIGLFTLMAGPDANSRDLEALIPLLQKLGSPALRADYWFLLALYFRLQGLPEISKKFSRACEQDREKIRHQLPEEYYMDFDKNQGFGSLEKALAGLTRDEATQKASPPANPTTNTGIPPERFKHFCQINRQLLEKEDLGEILEQVMDASILLSGAERGLLVLKEGGVKPGDPKEFQIKTARRIHQQALEQKDFQFSMSVVREACHQGAPVLTNNASADARFQEMQSVMQQQLKSILVVPFDTGASVSGAIYLDHRYAPDAFKPEDIDLLAALADQAALAIQKAIILAEVKGAKLQLEGVVQEQHHQIEVLSEELSQSRDQLKFDYPEIIGKSPAMMKVFQLLDNVTQTKIPVWIFGESGTGKELVARSLHFNSARKAKAFIAQNCGAIPENLLESELFGYKRGAFTHADRDREGLFEAADGGTLFLDEVADMSLAMQAKLLRVLQEGEVRPLGSNKSVKVDVRLVTASNRDLRRMVKEGSFRQDLFFRINGMTIPLPPLRMRKQDIPLLVHYLTKKIAKDFELKASPFGQDAMRALTDHSWPGNIRELEAVVRNAMLSANGATVTKKMIQLEESSEEWTSGSTMTPSIFPSQLESSSAELTPTDKEERRRLLDLLVKHQLDKKKVAAEMGLSLKTVYNAMERLGIPTKRRQLMMLLK